MTSTAAPLRPVSKPVYTGRTDFERHCSDEIIAAIKAGESVRCEGYSIDADDFTYFLSNRPEFTKLSMALLTLGNACEFQMWMERQLEAYADRHAGSRADYLEAVAHGLKDAERDHEAADFARESANEERLLGGVR